jgi:ketosteroid isomerase-like protein
MSQENVELARRTYEAFNRRDLDAVLNVFHPEVEIHDEPEIPDAAVHRGHEAVRRDWQRTFDFLDEFSIEIEDYRDLGDELLVFIRYRGVGHGSQVPVEATGAHLLTVRQGKLVRMRQFFDRTEALEAAGLRE